MEDRTERFESERIEPAGMLIDSCIEPEMNYSGGRRSFSTAPYFSFERKEIKDIEATKKEYLENLEKAWVDASNKLEWDLIVNLPKDDKFLVSEEVREAKKKGLILRLNSGWIDGVEDLMRNFNITKEVIGSEEVQEAAKRQFLHFLEKYADNAIKIKKILLIPDEYIKSEEIDNVVKAVFLKEVTEGYFLNIIKIKKEFFVPEDYIRSSEIQEKAKELFKKHLKTGYIADAAKIKNELFVPDEYLKTEEIQGISEKKFGEYMAKNSNANEAIWLKNSLVIGDEYIQTSDMLENSKKTIADMLEREKFEDIALFKKEFLVPDSMLLLEDLQSSAKSKFMKCMAEKGFSKAFTIKRDFFLQGEFVEGAEKDFLVKCINEENIESTKKAIEALVIPDVVFRLSEVQEALKARIIKNLEDGSAHSAERLSKAFLADEKIFDSVEIKDAATQGFIKCLDGGMYNFAAELNKIANISEKYILDYLKRITDAEEWRKAVKLQSVFPECKTAYEAFINDKKEAASDGSRSREEREAAYRAIAGLAKNGESGIGKYFAEIIKRRSDDKEINGSVQPFGAEQEGAFEIMLQLDVTDSNEALASTLDSENVDIDRKVRAVEALNDETRKFGDETTKAALREWIHSANPEDLDWKDMRFLKAIANKIPSNKLKDKSLGLIADAMGELNASSEGINGVWEKKYRNIPEDTFLQLWNFVEGDEELLRKFNILYASLKKESNRKANLLFTIVAGNDMNIGTRKLLNEKLREIDWKDKKDADMISNIVKRLTFLDNMQEYKDDEARSDADKEKQIEARNILSAEFADLKDLNAPIQLAANEMIQDILPNPDLDIAKVEKIEKKWEDIEPIFTYLGRFPDLRGYIAEMMVNFDDRDEWKKWRYDLNNGFVKEQVGFLSEEQLKIWKDDYFFELQDFVTEEVRPELPGQIQKLLREAISEHKHVHNPKEGLHEYEFIYKTLENYYLEIDKDPDRQDKIAMEKEKEILNTAKEIDRIISYDLVRIKKTLEKTFPLGEGIPFSKDIEYGVQFLGNYLSKETKIILQENFQRINKKSNRIRCEEIITPEILSGLDEKIQEIRRDYNTLRCSDAGRNIGLEKIELGDNASLYGKRQELKSCMGLLKLNSLSVESLAANKISGNGKKGESISSILENLKKYFKNSPFGMDLDNIEYALKEKRIVDEKKRLAMIITDEPQMSWLEGRYPLGRSTCQDYADGDYAYNLMGYVGDADCKTSYIIDINKLPQDIKDAIDEEGFEEAKGKMSSKVILSASIARKIFKLSNWKEGKAAILLEPAYAILSEDQASISRIFEIFAESKLARPMKAAMGRNGGEETVERGTSRSPRGQYEDLLMDHIEMFFDPEE